MQGHNKPIHINTKQNERDVLNSHSPESDTLLNFIKIGQVVFGKEDFIVRCTSDENRCQPLTEGHLSDSVNLKTRGMAIHSKSIEFLHPMMLCVKFD